MSAALIEARQLSLHAGGRCLVERLDWQCRAGERWCVIGRNAAGKTSLLRALAGLHPVDMPGDVLWQGRSATRWASYEAATRRAFMPQQTRDGFSLTVNRLLALSTCVPGPIEMAGLADRLGIAHLLGRDVRTLSGGERQRVALAQCAVQGAPAMLLDEPVASQDPAHQVRLSQWLVAPGFSETRGFVITAHDINWVAGVATHVLALMDGGEWKAGPADEMLEEGLLERVYGCRWERAGKTFVPC